MRSVVWVGRSLDAVRTFPDDARQRVGHQLWRVQTGRQPDDWKPLAGIATGVVEIRIHAGREFRLCYVATFEEAVYVLHAFEKKSQRMGRADADLVRARLSAVRALRGRRKP